MAAAKLSAVSEQAIIHAKQVIVSHALFAGVGGKLPTNVQLLEEHGIVAGTIQRALQILSASEALVTRSKGHMGREITQLDTGTCWNLAKLAPVQLLMPSSGSIEIDALIKHITAKLTALNIAYFIEHQPGGEKRVELVNKGKFDIALVSKGAADNMSSALETWQQKCLKPDSYYSMQRLVVVSRADKPQTQWRRIAIDPASSDHSSITQKQFPIEEGFEYLETDFRHVPARVLRGDVDAGLWHITASPVPLELAGLQAHRLSEPAAIEQHQAISAAAFVVNPKRPELVALLDEINSRQLQNAQSNAFSSEDPYAKAFSSL
ncbi:YhfZ family protein [Aliagarivorans marinus]|uniref:YhfZ family protein n=1 Tax=Aliagarivorans marinus TaxID=561965 RepID=UPI00041BA951|nr:YhfZ family protein [Aliagarivorans marinus]